LGAQLDSTEAKKAVSPRPPEEIERPRTNGQVRKTVAVEPDSAPVAILFLLTGAPNVLSRSAAAEWRGGKGRCCIRVKTFPEPFP